MSKEDRERAMAPIICFNEQIKNEVKQFERIKQGDFSDFQHLEDLGKLLIALRIARGVTQRELAGRLGVSEAQVSRDERNEYYRASSERVQQVLKALGEEIHLSVFKSTKSDKELVTN